MKKVRFESPLKTRICKMSWRDSDCHSPRPFSEQQFRSNAPDVLSDYPKLLVYNSDPVQRFECSNSIPYPTVAKTPLPKHVEKDTYYKPSNDLDLSLLDASNLDPRKPTFSRTVLKPTDQNVMYGAPIKSVLTPSENNSPPNVLVKDDSFFIRRDNLEKFNMKPLQKQFDKLSFGKENDPLVQKAELMRKGPLDAPLLKENIVEPVFKPSVCGELNECGCYHCNKVPQPPAPRAACLINRQLSSQNHFPYPPNNPQVLRPGLTNHCCYPHPQSKMHHNCGYTPQLPPQCICQGCNCNKTPSQQTPTPPPVNAIDKKTWAIEKYEQKNKPSTEIEKQSNISKEKREPTVADLFKIIKLQNEQLQLLQEKVDKFITASNRPTPQPTITCTTEHVELNSVDNEQVKMSIGVMTSFEMVHTSTVINKEVVKQSSDNAQIQCNRSQISINKVVSKPVNLNFLDGIAPVQSPERGADKEDCNESIIEQVRDGEEKILNDLSLYNVQVDNATTPLMSPEQTLYLDVRDYSGSETESVDQSNVGWTYYNKVMTHVNGMLQDSEMPSSASAMFRNMRQHCVQMQIDKTNVSVTKRVKFGDDPLGIHQPHIYTPPSTDTSMKMNQLAAKYLRTAPKPPSKQTAVPVEMSFATRNYMERHRLLQGLPSSSKSPPAPEIPRFLDITALKQQPKFL